MFNLQVRGWTVKVLALLISATLSTTGQAYQTHQYHLDNLFSPHLPSRDQAAPTGLEFVSRLSQMKVERREKAIVDEILKGNIPNFLRTMVPVTIQSPQRNRKVASVTFWVMPDYLAVGTDYDYVRMPMNLHSAERIANAFNLRLPTRKMVDAIYQKAEIKLRPRPMRPGPQMTSLQYYRQHHSMIEKDLSHLGPFAGRLIAGHKKDVVQSSRLLKKPGSIAIYGWHQSSGKPIQPLSTVHHAGYADYSHGIRMVANHVEIKFRNGQTQQMSLDEILNDWQLCSLLSDEGRLDRKQLILEANRTVKAKRSS